MKFDFTLKPCYHYCMIHEMRLNAPSFDKIVDGSKTIELRLLDDKRKAVKLGDVIEFVKEGTSETVQRKVMALLNFPDFESLIDYLPLQLFGHQNKESIKEGVNMIYSIERQKEKSVLGIIIAPLR